ncbi:hypothetical protein SprV_0501911000 [Sparganum proliferum]
MSHLQDFAGALIDKAVFSNTDLVRAFHQIPVVPKDIPKTDITTPFGLFEFIRMPFDLRNAAQTFQRFIDHVFRGLPFVYAYIADLLMASRNEEEHIEHLALVFDRLDKFGVVINPSKCLLDVSSLEFLGHQTCRILRGDKEDVVNVDWDKAAVIEESPELPQERVLARPCPVIFYLPYSMLLHLPNPPLPHLPPPSRP